MSEANCGNKDCKQSGAGQQNTQPKDCGKGTKDCGGGKGTKDCGGKKTK